MKFLILTFFFLVSAVDCNSMDISYKIPNPLGVGIGCLGLCALYNVWNAKSINDISCIGLNHKCSRGNVEEKTIISILPNFGYKHKKACDSRVQKEYKFGFWVDDETPGARFLLSVSPVALICSGLYLAIKN